MLSVRSVLLLSTLTAVLGGVAGAGTSLLVRGQSDQAAAAGAADEPGGANEAVDLAVGAPSAGSNPTGGSDGASSTGADRERADTPDLDPPTLRELAIAVDEATAERSQLAATLVGLNRDIEALEQVIGAFNLPAGEASGGATPDGASGAGAQLAGADGGGGRGAGRGRGGIDTDSLLAAGVDPQVSAELEQRNDAWQLARLELVDRAAREGWDDSDELDEQLEQLDGERPDLREELGDDRYDAYLYESGRPNRVSVATVIPGSAAASAGLRENDILLDYADERLFDVRSLQRATRSGNLGEGVTVRVLRDGQVLQVQVQRGPLGVSLGPGRREP